MTALASTDVTVTMNARDRDIGHKGLDKFMGIASIVFGDGALTYPTGGVPLPAIGNFGLQRQVDIGIIEPPYGDGYVYKYDRTNHKILIYTAAGGTPTGTVSQPTFTGAAATPTGAVAAPTFAGVAATPTGTVSQPTFAGSELAGHTHTLTDGSLLYTWAPGGGDIKGSTEPAGTEAAADTGPAPVNAILIGTEETFTAMGGTKAVAVSPDVPRNIIMVIHNDSGGPLDLFEGDTTYTITGTFRGAAQVETLVWTSTVGNKALATANYRYLAGVKPFDTITSITYTNGAAGDLKCSVAPGSALGYPVDSDTAAEADFTKVTVDAADFTITGAVDLTNKTFTVGTIADDADVEIQYVVDYDQGAASSDTAGTPAGTVSTPTFSGVEATPTGTVSAPAFTGVEATPTGTVSQPTFTGAAVAAAALAELGSAITPAATTIKMLFIGE